MIAATAAAGVAAGAASAASAAGIAAGIAGAAAIAADGIAVAGRSIGIAASNCAFPMSNSYYPYSAWSCNEICDLWSLSNDFYPYTICNVMGKAIATSNALGSHDSNWFMGVDEELISLDSLYNAITCNVDVLDHAAIAGIHTSNDYFPWKPVVNAALFADSNMLYPMSAAWGSNRDSNWFTAVDGEMISLDSAFDVISCNVGHLEGAVVAGISASNCVFPWWFTSSNMLYGCSNELYDYRTWSSNELSNIDTELTVLDNAVFGLGSTNAWCSNAFAGYTLTEMTPAIPTGQINWSSNSFSNFTKTVDLPSLVGATGPAGSNGLDGVAGSMGPTGSNGLDGLAGGMGPAGSNGLDGVAGSMGPAGSNGLDGVAGGMGPAGSNGLPGPTGSNSFQFNGSNMYTLCNCLSIATSNNPFNLNVAGTAGCCGLSVGRSIGSIANAVVMTSTGVYTDTNSNTCVYGLCNAAAGGVLIKNSTLSNTVATFANSGMTTLSNLTVVGSTTLSNLTTANTSAMSNVTVSGTLTVSGISVTGGGGSNPVASVLLYASSNYNIPSNYFWCNGQTITASNYSTLFTYCSNAGLTSLGANTLICGSNAYSNLGTPIQSPAFSIGGYAACNLFDNGFLDASSWIGSNIPSVSNSWAGVTWASGKTVTSYRYYSTSGYRVVDAFQFQGSSNAGSNWTVLDVRSNQAAVINMIALGTPQWSPTYVITSNVNAYTSYRLYVTASSCNQEPAVADLSMYSQTAAYYTTPSGTVGGNYQLMKYQ
jgi:hypothetical protein